MDSFFSLHKLIGGSRMARPTPNYCTTASVVFDDVIRELGALRGLRAIQV